MDSYCRPTTGKSSSPAGLSAHLSRLFQRHLRSFVRAWVWVWDGFRVQVSIPAHTPSFDTELLQNNRGEVLQPSRSIYFSSICVRSRLRARPPHACYSTQWFPDDPDAPSIEATPLTATSADLVSGWVWVWDWVHLHTQSPRTRSPEEMCVCSHRSASQDTLRNCTKCRGILAHTRIKPSLSWRQMRLLVESCCAQLTI